MVGALCVTCAYAAADACGVFPSVTGNAAAAAVSLIADRREQTATDRNKRHLYI